MKQRIIIDDKIPFIRGVLEPYADVRYLPAPAIEPASVHDADMLIVRTRTRCDAALLDGSRCRFVVHIGKRKAVGKPVHSKVVY